MAKSFWRKDIVPKCTYCARCERCIGTDTFVCKKRGIVSAEESCRKFKYDPLRRVPQSEPSIPKFSEEDFEI